MNGYKIKKIQLVNDSNSNKQSNYLIFSDKLLDPDELQILKP